MTAVSATLPACVAADATLEEKEVVRSSATISIKKASRRLSADDSLDIDTELGDGSKAKIHSSFRKAMATTLDIAVSKVVVEEDATKLVAGQDADTYSLVISFYVEADADTLTALTSTLASIASGTGDGVSLLSDLADSFTEELESAGVAVTVESVLVSEPEVGTIFVAQPTEAPTDDSDEGGGSGAIIAVVVVVVLVVVGLVVYKFVLKK
jgi:hypothetical protein